MGGHGTVEIAQKNREGPVPQNLKNMKELLVVNSRARTIRQPWINTICRPLKISTKKPYLNAKTVEEHFWPNHLKFIQDLVNLALKDLLRNLDRLRKCLGLLQMDPE